MSIPGIPGASEPTFRTRDARWMGLDALVQETVTVMKEEGVEVSLVAAKTTIQLGRIVVQEPIERDSDELIGAVYRRLRGQRVLIPIEVVQKILATYAQVIVTLDVLEINELG